MIGLTQDKLIDRDVQQHFAQRAQELMADAQAAGFVINLNMHSTKQKETFQSLDSIVVARDGGSGETFIWPNKGPYW